MVVVVANVFEHLLYATCGFFIQQFYCHFTDDIMGLKETDLSKVA